MILFTNAFVIQVCIRGSRVFRAINFLFRYVKVLRFCRKVSLLTFNHICMRINVIAFFISTYSGIQRVFELIDRNSQCKDTRKVSKIVETSSAVGVEPVHDFCVEFKDVSYSYRSRPTVRVLNDLSVKISDKRITCFVGESGSGKSTFAALLCGLYRPLAGIDC